MPVEQRYSAELQLIVMAIIGCPHQKLSLSCLTGVRGCRMLPIFIAHPEESVKALLQPWQLLLLVLAGWVNRRQQDVIEYLLAKNQVLRQKLGKKRILLTDDQPRQLAVKGKILGRKMLEQLNTVFTPDTILRWHRELFARHRNYSGRRKHVGRPPISKEGHIHFALLCAICSG